MSDLRKRLAEVLAEAWPGEWIVIDDDGEPCIEAVDMYDKPCRYFVVDSGGVGGDTSDEPETATPFENAEAIAAAVNYLRSPEFARALEDAERVAAIESELSELQGAAVTMMAIEIDGETAYLPSNMASKVKRAIAERDELRARIAGGVRSTLTYADVGDRGVVVYLDESTFDAVVALDGQTVIVVKKEAHE